MIQELRMFLAKKKKKKLRMHSSSQIIDKRFYLWFIYISISLDHAFIYVQVHHMIEKCLIFNMSKEECVEALSKHANITPVITSTGFPLSPFLNYTIM